MQTRSPFPGMDPWLEQHWGDVHHALITYARDALNQRLPAGLRARMEERVYLECETERIRQRIPDVRIVEYPGAAGTSSRAATAVAEPLIVELDNDPVTETFIQIIDVQSGNRVITVIEILSPTNKGGGIGQELYERKQNEVISSRASLVEIDLLREGHRVMLSNGHAPPSHRTPYQACVYRGWRPLKLEIYRIPLRERLPAIKIPLREADADVPLDLQSLVDQEYTNGGYDTIDYSAGPVPPLPPEDAAWADNLLKSTARR